MTNADLPLWPPHSVLRASTHIQGGGFVDRAPFEAEDNISAGAPWTVVEGAIGPGADTSQATALAIFGEAAWRTARLFLSIDPLGRAVGVVTAVAGLPADGQAVVFVDEEGTTSLRVLRRSSGAVMQLGGAPLPAALGGAVRPWGCGVRGRQRRRGARHGAARASGAG